MEAVSQPIPQLAHGEEIPPGTTALARLRLDEPFVTLRGDRFVLRSMEGTTVGGGTVLDLSDRTGPDVATDIQ